MQPTLQRILVPTDFSPSSDRAFEYAVVLAGAFGASIHLVHVLHDPFAAQSAWEYRLPEAPEFREQMYREAKARLATLAGRRADPTVTVSTEVRLGGPMEEINAAAMAYGSDLIVMGTHGRTGLPHLLLGSIAERVLRTAPCPVLTVRESLLEREMPAIEALTIPAA